MLQGAIRQAAYGLATVEKGIEQKELFSEHLFHETILLMAER
jgi:hypothetical protein